MWLITKIATLAIMLIVMAVVVVAMAACEKLLCLCRCQAFHLVRGPSIRCFTLRFSFSTAGLQLKCTLTAGQVHIKPPAAPGSQGRLFTLTRKANQGIHTLCE